MGSRDTGDTTAIIITTRGNPEKLTMTILALSRLAAKPQLVTYAIRYDSDDKETEDAISRLQKHVNIVGVCGGQLLAMGTANNEAAAAVPDAAFYHVLNDDIVPLTPDWDLPQLARRDQQFYFTSCWQLVPRPTAPDYPIISRAWYEAAGRRIFTDSYAYWFDDMDLSNRYLLATGQFVQALNISEGKVGPELSAKKAKTSRMRDFEFWYTVFRFTEDERIAWAQQTADNLGFKVNIREQRQQVIDQLRVWDTKWYSGHAKGGTVKLLGDDSPPSEGYLLQKAKMSRHILEKGKLTGVKHVVTPEQLRELQQKAA